MMTSDDYEMMKSSQFVLMDDLCNIYHSQLSSGTYSPQDTETFTVVSGVACGIQYIGRKIKPLEQTSVQSEQTVLIDYDVVLRLPASQPIFITDHIELVEKGEFLVSGTFQPSDAPRISSSVQKVTLKRVLT